MFLSPTSPLFSENTPEPVDDDDVDTDEELPYSSLSLEAAVSLEEDELCRLIVDVVEEAEEEEGEDEPSSLCWLCGI